MREQYIPFGVGELRGGETEYRIGTIIVSTCIIHTVGTITTALPPKFGPQQKGQWTPADLLK
jgi:hypothetical protein